MKKHLEIPHVKLLFAVLFFASAFHMANDVLAYTGCAGDVSNTTVVTEYIFHEGGGSTAYNTGTDDGIGDLMLTNGVTFSNDVPPANTNCGYSASIPATGSGATTPALETGTSYDPLAGATNFTIMAWVKRQSASTASNQSSRIVSDTSSTSLTNTTAGFEFRFSGASGTLALRVNGNELSTTVGGIAPNDGTWHHVAVVYDGSRLAANALTRHAHFYVDGVQRGLGVSNSTANVSVSANTNRFTVGNSSVGRTIANVLVGKIDDVRILRGFAPAAVGDGVTNATILCYMNNKDDYPVIDSCPGTATANTSSGQCYASNVSLGEQPTAHDDCSGVITITNNAPAMFPVGTNLVTWTVHANGNFATTNQTVIVVDNQAPSITCPGDVTVNTTGSGCASNHVNLGQAVASDNCFSVSVANDAPATFPIGTTPVTWTATDTSGNTAYCVQYVTVVGDEQPTIECPGDVVVNADAGQCQASGVNLGQPIVSENCGIASLTNDATAAFPVGIFVVTWTVTDANGASNFCQQTVTVLDNQPPTISCPAAVTVNADAGQCSATNVNLGAPTISDNCTGATVTNDAPEAFPVGTTPVTWTVTDIGGHSASCQQAVTVVDALKIDSDNDGLPDCWELASELDANDAHDANQDADGDGFTNYEEYWMGTDPQNPDDPVTIHVDASYTDTVESGGPDTPYKQIQSAVNAASATEVTAIRVRPGVYNERPYIAGKANIHIFADAGPLTTIIDGEHINSSVVRIYDFTHATFRGFTIRNASTDWLGAGLRIEATNGVILVANNIITGNVTTNTSSSGGGGGIYIKTADGSRLVNNFITRNSARRGGGVLFAAGTVQFWHNTVADNFASTGNGGGVSALQNIRPDIRNNVIWGNAGTGTVAQVHSTSNLLITNNVVQGGVAGVNNINADPKFISPLLNDYRIRADSSARDAAVNLPLTWDADNEFRPESAAKDIGADEYVDGASIGIPDSWMSRYGLGDPEADDDNDGLTNRQEYELGTDPRNPDTDSDGLIDGCDPHPLATDVAHLSYAGNDGPVCVGDTLQLFATNVLGGSFSWTGPDGFTSTEQNPTITNAQPSHAGVYHLTETAEGESPVESCTVGIVAAFPSATIAAPDSVCPGFAGITASVPNAGPGAVYQWSIANGYITEGQDAQTIVWRANDSGTVYLQVSVTNAVGCGSSNSLEISVACPTNALGLRGEYFANRDFTNLKFTRLDQAIDFNWAFGFPGAGIGKDDFSVRWTGQFVPQYSEAFTFYTLSATGVRVWIDDHLVVDDWNKPSPTGHSGTIPLTAGHVYSIKVEYYAAYGRAYVRLWWSSPSLPKEIVPFTQPLPVDTIVSGVPDAVALALGLTGPNAAAQSGTVAMAEQVFQALNDPHSDDLDGTVSDVIAKYGYEANNFLGQWETNDTDIAAVDGRGFVEYSVDLGTADVYRIEIEGREQDPDPSDTSWFDLKVYADGEYLGRQYLVATTSIHGKIHVYTPWLQPGTHTVRIFWDNARSSTSLRLIALRFQSINGPDADQNGIKDWVEMRLRKMCRVDLGTPTSSYVSPVCLEGRGGWLSMLAVEANGTSVVAKLESGEWLYPAEKTRPPHILDRWYANVPLASDTNTQIVVSYQNGGLVEIRSIQWVAKNIFDGDNLIIRKGDSLMLTAAPEGASSGTVTITIAGETYESNVDSPIIHQFNEDGTYVVAGEFTPDQGNQQSSNITVKVISHSFADSPECLVGMTRTWDSFGVPTEIVIAGDPKFERFQQTNLLTNDGRRTSLLIDQNEGRPVVSRIGTTGPILDSVTAAGCSLFHALQTYNVMVEEYEDGSKLMETLLVLSPLPPQVKVQARIIVGGCTFDDGTTVKDIESADFDQLGEYKLRFVVSASAQAANCHELAVYQTTNLIGKY